MAKPEIDERIDTTQNVSMKFPVGLQVDRLAKNWGWLFAAGALSFALGFLALNLPLQSTLALNWGLAIIFLINGVSHLIQFVQFRGERGGAGRLFQSIISIIAGVLMLRYPAAGIMGVTVTLSFFFFVNAFGKWIYADSLRPQKGWGWLFVSSIVSFLLGVFIIASFPISALWIPGTILGVDLIVTGVAAMAFALNLRTLHRKVVKGEYKIEETGRAA